ncbi:MAG: ECF-type sigma factor [Planctomycetota bacterium]
MIHSMRSADGCNATQSQPASDPDDRGLSDVTRALAAMRSGRPEDVNHFWSLVDETLRRVTRRLIGRRARSGGMIHTTAVLNEAYLQLLARGSAYWRDAAHFYASASQTIRHSLINWIRREWSEKRGGNCVHVTLEVAGELALRKGLSPLDILALDEALAELTEKDPRSARVVELRYFGGLTVKEVSAVLGVAERTVENDWHYARSWLHYRLSK